MKITFKSVAFLAAMSFLAAGCQKEKVVEPGVTTQATQEIRHVRYSIDGEVYYTALQGRTAWNRFWERMVALAESGHRVSVRNLSTDNNAMTTKEVHHFETTSKEEAQAWCEQKMLEGYETFIDFDKETGKYICTANN